MLTFSCPRCGMPLRAPDSAAGEIAACGHCRSHVTVPPRPAARDTGDEGESGERPLNVAVETGTLLFLLLCSLAVPFFTFVAVWDGRLLPLLVAAGCSVPLVLWATIAFPEQAHRFKVLTARTAEAGARKSSDAVEGHVWPFFRNYVWPAIYWCLYACVVVVIAVLGVLFVVLLAMATQGKGGTLRPLNSCGRCGHTWYPRGSNYSARCPNCGASR